MIVDLRTYTLRAGALRPFLELHEARGLPIQRRHLGEPIGYFTTEIGRMNQVVHLWGYASFAEREARRAAFTADPEWIEYLAHVDEKGWIIDQEVKILRSARFSAI